MADPNDASASAASGVAIVVLVRWKSKKQRSGREEEKSKIGQQDRARSVRARQSCLVSLSLFLASPPSMAGQPPRAVLPSVYLGSERSSSSLPLLHLLNVTAILIIKSEGVFVPAFPQAFRYRVVQAGSEAHLIASAFEVSSFIISIVNVNDGTVMVCHDGNLKLASFLLAM